MVKFDPEGFNAMMDRIAAEDAAKAAAEPKYEDMDPDFEFLPDSPCCGCFCHG